MSIFIRSSVILIFVAVCDVRVFNAIVCNVSADIINVVKSVVARTATWLTREVEGEVVLRVELRESEGGEIVGSSGERGRVSELRGSESAYVTLPSSSLLSETESCISGNGADVNAIKGAS